MKAIKADSDAPFPFAASLFHKHNAKSELLHAEDLWRPPLASLSGGVSWLSSPHLKLVGVLLLPGANPLTREGRPDLEFPTNCGFRPKSQFFLSLRAPPRRLRLRLLGRPAALAGRAGCLFGGNGGRTEGRTDRREDPRPSSKMGGKNAAAAVATAQTNGRVGAILPSAARLTHPSCSPAGSPACLAVAACLRVRTNAAATMGNDTTVPKRRSRSRMRSFALLPPPPPSPPPSPSGHPSLIPLPPTKLMDSGGGSNDRFLLAK